MNKLTSTLVYFIFTFIFIINSYASFEQTAGISGRVIAIFINGQDIYASVQGGGVRLTTNNGDTWSDISNELGTRTVSQYVILNNAIFVTTNTGVFKTTNRGANWVQLSYSANGSPTAIEANGNDLYVGNSIFQVYKSTNQGDTWALLWDGPFFGQVNDIMFYDNKIFVAANKVYVSANGGANWTYDNMSGSAYSYILQVNGNTIRAGGSGGGYKNTTPTGGWVRDNPWGNAIYGFGLAGSYIMNGGTPGIFWSSDNGATWHDPTYAFLYNIPVYSMAQNSQYVFAGGQYGFYRKSVASFIGISIISTNIPKEFSLYQNYPNPFNPETNIKFDIPKTSYIVLEVYNQLGEAVASLVNQKLDAGTYEYNFNTAGLSSAVYYYRLITEDYSYTRKMILIK